MFRIQFDGKIIGCTALEDGDPPMGCAEGLFIPSAEFERFQATVPGEEESDPSIKRWIGLSVSTDEGDQIECIDVVLFEYNFGDEKELRVDAVGIGSPLYE